MELAEIVDRELIGRTLRRYAQGVDQRQWPVFHSAFAEGATVRIPGYLDGAVTPLGFERLLGGTFDSTRLSGQHFLGNTLFRIDGDTARTVTEFLAVTTERAEGTHGAAGEAVAVQHSAGLYVDDLVRADDNWLILRRTLVRKSDDIRTVPYGATQWTAVASAASNSVTAGL